MYRSLLLIAIVVCIFSAGVVCAQDAGGRAQSLAAALDKTQYKKKEKGIVKVEFYIDIKNTPAVMSAAAYSGVYDTQVGYRLVLNVDASGAATGSGYDSLNEDGAKANFTLRDARVQNAVLTATKVYDNGQTQNFEAVFVNRTVSAGTSPDKVTDTETVYGIGFVQAWGSSSNRVFLERK